MTTQITFQADKEVKLPMGQTLQVEINGEPVTLEVIGVIDMPDMSKKPHKSLRDVVKGRINLAANKPFTREEIYDR